MRIVIAGAGEVGTYLAKMLTHEEQNIVLIDPDPKRIEDITNHIEVLTVVGNPLYLEDLESAFVRGADLFVSVLPDGTSNLLACALAKKVGAKYTIARVNSHHHLEPEYQSLYEGMGIDRIIYPEELAAQEIVATTLNPWARQYFELFNGAMVLVAVKIREGAPILGKKLHELNTEIEDRDSEKFCHVVALKRDLETIIPNGNTEIKLYDLVYFTCSKQYIDQVRQLAGKTPPQVEKMVIMGASRVAIQVVKRIPSHIKVCLIERSKEVCQSLITSKPRNVEIYHGDGRDPDIINEIGLDDAQVFVALTENSETNVLACLAAKGHHVYKTIAKEENIDYIPLAYRLDIGTLINKKILAAGHIYRTLLGQKSGSYICLSLMDNTEVAELVVGRISPLVNKRVKDLKLPFGLTFGGMLRNGVLTMIDGNTVFEAYDHIVVFYHNVNINTLQKLFYTN